MDYRGSAPHNLAVEPCSMSDNPSYGDEDLDEETVNYITALYAALGPLLPEVTKLQGHQDPPAHLMVDMKAKLRELGSSVSDARKRLLRYNIYLKKRLAKAVQEKKAWKEQQLRQQGEDGSEQASTAYLQRGPRTQEMEPGMSSMGVEKKTQEIPPSELSRAKTLERAYRRSVKMQDPRFGLVGEDGMVGPRESIQERARAYTSPQGILQRGTYRPDNMATRSSIDRSQL